MVARRAHNPEVVGSSPASATNQKGIPDGIPFLLYIKVAEAGLEQVVPRFKRQRKSKVKTLRVSVFRPPRR